MKFTGVKKTFLENPKNKLQIILLIGCSLKKANCTVIYSLEDADVDIAKTACKMAASRNVTVVGEDSDLLILLLYFSVYRISSYKLVFKSDVHNTAQHDIYRYLEILGKDLCIHLLFVHAFSGCDTTSSFFDVGKGTVFKF